MQEREAYCYKNFKEGEELLSFDKIIHHLPYAKYFIIIFCLLWDSTLMELIFTKVREPVEGDYKVYVLMPEVLAIF